MSIIRRGDDMKKIFVQLTCRCCFYQTHKESETLILPEIEKDLKQALLNEDFFIAKCPQCGNKIEFLHPCLYVDKKHNYMLYIKSKKGWKHDDHLKFDDQITRRRYVYEFKRIAEKIRLFDDGFDDRMMELLKLKLRSHLELKHECVEDVIYYDFDRSSQTIWFSVFMDNQTQNVAVLLQSYKNIEKNHSLECTLQFIEINDTWAMLHKNIIQDKRKLL